VLEECLGLVEDRRRQVEERLWKYKRRNGDEIPVRDILGKALLWINKFKEIGDMAVQYSQSHATLPWAGVRFILQVST
jgi:hypothetical protein